jgi:hypothetical protein
MSKNPTKCRKKDLASSPTGTRKNAVVNRRIRGRQKQNFKDQAFKTWLLQGDVEPTADEKYWKGYFEERSALDKLRSGSLLSISDFPSSLLPHFSEKFLF